MHLSLASRVAVENLTSWYFTATNSHPDLTQPPRTFVDSSWEQLFRTHSWESGFRAFIKQSEDRISRTRSRSRWHSTSIGSPPHPSSTTMAREEEPPPSESTTHDSGNHSGAPDLRFVHYNDVYHVEQGSREPVGGIARFLTVCDYYRDDAKFADQPELMTLFSGDAFNPSLESSVTKGRHMVPVMNILRTTVSCLGYVFRFCRFGGLWCGADAVFDCRNHDLDFGVKQFRALAEQCNFPWLCANVLDPALGDTVPLGNCKRTEILTSSNGIKIGFIGIVEREWLDTINILPPNLQYLSASATAAELAPGLREQGAEIVIVLSHQREPNDVKLATKLEPGTVDIILGGHDHYYGHSIVNGTHLLRSGTDFKQLSYLEARRKPDGSKGWDFNITRRDIVSSIPPEPKAMEMVEKITAALRPKLEKPIGYTAAPLDARFTTVRLKESNLGNFVCDLMRLHYDADCCIMASGTIRGDQIYPPGVLRVKDMMNCFPFEDPCVVIQVQGKNIVDALENAVSKYPALEGRFAQVSGITFTFDPTKPEGDRCSDILIKGHPVDFEKEYKLVTRDYMVRGKDGFTSLMLEEEGGPAKSIVGDETGMLISMILRQYFMSLKVLGRWKNWGASMGRLWGGIHDGLHVVHPVREPVRRGEAHDEKGIVSQPGNEDGVGMDPSLVGKAQKEKENWKGHAHSRSVSGPPRKRQQTEHVSTAANGNGGSGAEMNGLSLEDSDSENDASDLPAVIPDQQSRRERELQIMRKVMRKWWRLAGLPGHPRMCEEKGEEFGVMWTKGIAPRLEGRIRIVGEDA